MKITNSKSIISSIIIALGIFAGCYLIALGSRYQVLGNNSSYMFDNWTKKVWNVSEYKYLPVPDEVDE